MRNSLVIRILIVNNYARVTGGADLHCLQITEGLRARGHDVHWLSTASSNNVETEGDFVPLIVGGENREQLPLASRLRAVLWALWNPAASRATKAIIRQFNPDVMHVHKAYVQLSVSPVVAASRHGVPVVQTVHDYEFVSASPFDSSGSYWDSNESSVSFQALNSATFLAKNAAHRPRVDRWIAVSDSVARCYREQRDIDCTVIPNFAARSSKPVIPHSKRRGILFLGRLSNEKGVEDLLKVAKFNPETPFIFAGGGPLTHRVAEAARAVPNIEYKGFVSQSEGSDLLRHAVACAVPSLWEEPGALVALEAMAEATPVICYPKGGLMEYVSDAEAGIVCRHTDYRELSAAVRTLETESAAWEKYSANGQIAIAGRHSRTKYLDSLETVYGSAIESRA